MRFAFRRVAIPHVQVLYRAADPLQRHRDRHDAAGSSVPLQPAGCAVPANRAADHPGDLQLRRGERRGCGQHHWHSNRGCGQRGRELDLHAVHQRQRWQLYAHDYLRGRHQSQHFIGFGSKRGKHREAGTAAGSSIPGSQCQKGQHQHPADREPLLRRQPLQRYLSGQLRNHQSAESARAPAGSRANQRVGRGALQHADLARSGQAQVLRADRA